MPFGLASCRSNSPIYPQFHWSARFSCTPNSHSEASPIRRSQAFHLRGSIPGRSKDVIPALRSLLQTTLTSGAKAFLNIWVTNDFANTIQTTTTSSGILVIRGDFLRSIQWILSSSEQSCLVLLSPSEANDLIDEVRKSSVVTLHVYSPRTSRQMRSFDDPRSFVILYCESAPDIPS